MARNLLILLPTLLLSACAVQTAREGGSSRTPTEPLPQVRDFTPPIPSHGPRSRVAVLPFLDGAQGAPVGLLEEARSRLLSHLQNRGKSVVIRPEDMGFEIGDYLRQGSYELEKMAPHANKAGVAALIEAELVDVRRVRQGDEVGIFREVRTRIEGAVRVRAVATRTGREIYNQTIPLRSGQASTRVTAELDEDKIRELEMETLRRMLDQAMVEASSGVQAAIERLEWEGRIARVQGERIFLNVGQISGVQMGDILRVTEEGNDIYDPQTGGLIGRVPGRLKGTVEVVSYFGQDGSIAVIHSGSGFQENDRIELY